MLSEQKQALFSIEERIALKNAFFRFIVRVLNEDCAHKTREEVAILPDILRITADLF